MFIMPFILIVNLKKKVPGILRFLMNLAHASLNLTMLYWYHPSGWAAIRPIVLPKAATLGCPTPGRIGAARDTVPAKRANLA